MKLEKEYQQFLKNNASKIIRKGSFSHPIDNTSDSINPRYYKHHSIQCIDAIEGLELNFHEAQVLKYIARWQGKGGITDLMKALWYLRRLIWLNTPEKERDKVFQEREVSP